MKRNRYLIAIAILAVLWLQAELRCWLLNRELDHVYQNEVTVKAVDAVTHQPLRYSVELPGTSPDNRWPKVATVALRGDPSMLKIMWLSTAPINIRVKVDGYEAPAIQLDSTTTAKIVVPLRRLTAK